MRLAETTREDSQIFALVSLAVIVVVALVKYEAIFSGALILDDLTYFPESMTIKSLS